MKKALAIILTFSVLFVMGGWTFPQDNGSENRFSLILTGQDMTAN